MLNSVSFGSKENLTLQFKYPTSKNIFISDATRNLLNNTQDRFNTNIKMETTLKLDGPEAVQAKAYLMNTSKGLVDKTINIQA